jgi:hypothetical protein
MRSVFARTFAAIEAAHAAAMEAQVEAKGKHLDTMYFFYTTCPKCARHYGKNDVVGVAKVT